MKLHVLLGCSALAVSLLLAPLTALSHPHFHGVFPPEPPSPVEAEAWHQKMQQHRANRLGLSKEQQTKIEQIEKSFFESHQTQMEQMRTDHLKLKSQIEAILTPEQKEKLKYQTKNPPNPPFGPPPCKPDPPEE